MSRALVKVEEKWTMITICASSWAMTNDLTDLERKI